MRLSKRMEAVCAMVSPGNILADVGCDHGYVSIALVERGICPSAIAMDLRGGPLAKAEENIVLHGLSGKIQTRLSDGVSALLEGEAQSIVIAGMGGDLILHILSEGGAVCRCAREMILQPQSQIHKVRLFLWENGCRIVQEDMVCEDGKFYPMMRVIPAEERGERPTDIFLYYGEHLLRRQHPVLLDFLRKEEKTLSEVEKNLKKQTQTQKARIRLAELEEEQNRNRQAQIFYNGIK